MRPLLALLATLLLATGGWIYALTPSNLADEINTTVGAYSTQLFPQTYLSGEPGRAIVIGDGKTYLGLYIYDSFGNCIDKDDLNHASARDDIACVWHPLKTETYGIEIVNLGRFPNKYLLTCK